MTLPDDMYMGEQSHRAHTAIRDIINRARELDALKSEAEGGWRALKVEEPHLLKAMVDLQNLLCWVYDYHRDSV
jgi:hypothetical protein